MGAKFLFVLSLLVYIGEAHRQHKLFNVKYYGARSDGNTDNSVVIFHVHSFSFFFYFLTIAILILMS